MRHPSVLTSLATRGAALGFGLSAVVMSAPRGSAQIKLPEPITGVYSVDPKGQGPRVFTSLEQAIRYVSLVGFKGELTLEIAPGDYEGPLTFFPVRDQKDDQRLVVRRKGVGAVRLTSDNGIVHLQEGCKWIVFDGLEFGESGSSPSMKFGNRCTDIEIRNCHFTEETGSQQIIEIRGNRDSRRFSIHHNKFEMGRGNRRGIYTQSTFELDIHHNEFVCTDGGEPISIWNANESKSKVYENVFRGTLSKCCMRLDVSGHGVKVFNNLFLLEMGNNDVGVIHSQGLRRGAFNEISHNLFVIRTGCGVRTKGPFAIDHNTYAIGEDAAIGMTNNDRHATMKEWRSAIEPFVRNEMGGAGSAVAAPGFWKERAALVARFHDFEKDARDDDDGGEAVETNKANDDGEDEKARLKAERTARRADIRKLVGYLAIDDPAVQRLAMRALREQGRFAASALPALGRLCAHAHAPIRADAVETVLAIRVGAEILVPELIKLLGDADTRVLAVTMRALAAMKHLATEARPRLLELKAHKNEDVQSAAEAALRALGEPTREPK